MKYLILLFLLSPILIISQITEDLSSNIPLAKAKWYAKGLYQHGVGFEPVFIGTQYYITPHKPYDIYIQPGGGVGLEAVIGNYINPSLSGEIGIGFLQSGYTDDITFNKWTLRTSVIYRLKSSKEYVPYVGGGLSTNLSVYFKLVDRDDTTITKYETPIGFHILGGVQKNFRQYFFWFGEFKLIFLGTYNIKEAEFNGNTVPISSIESDFREMNANGYQFIFGVGWYIK